MSRFNIMPRTLRRKKQTQDYEASVRAEAERLEAEEAPYLADRYWDPREMVRRIDAGKTQGMSASQAVIGIYEVPHL